MTGAETIDIGTWTEWKAANRPAQLVDVRSTTEFAAGHMPGAFNIPLDQIELRMADLAGSGPVVLVCQGGTRSRIALELLAGHDRDLKMLDGGTDAWIKSGHPVIRNTVGRWALERQVRLVAGLLAATGTLLGVTVSLWWLVVPAFVGCGLTFAGVSGICPMGEMLARLPWNRARLSANTAPTGRETVSCVCRIADRQ